jgi:spermidine synthase
MAERALSGKLLSISLFIASAAGIAYQVALMRIFSIAHWHHFAYMIISIAMLGFGAAGVLLTFARRLVAGKEERFFTWSTLLLAISMVACHLISVRVPFETFHLFTQRAQLGYLFILYAVLATPFFLVSCCITLAMLLNREAIGRVYAVNLAGSGAGAAVLVGLLFIFPPHHLPWLLSLPVLAVSLVSFRVFSRGEKVAALILLAVSGVLALVGETTPETVSQYKPLAYALKLPDAEIVAQTQSPLSRIVAVRSSMLRETPGQIGGYAMREQGGIPEQIGLFFDAGGVSVINRFDGDLSRFAWLNHVTPAVAFQLVSAPDVLVIGAGGGTDVLMALSLGARHVTAVEVDPRVFALVNEEFREFSGGLYQREDVRLVVADGRGFLQGSSRRYDLIQIALLDSFNAAAAGVYALSESYLYTLEAMELYLNRLSPTGVLSVTRWLKTPARDAVRMFGVMTAALERTGVSNPGDHMVMIRSWNTATLVASRSPLTASRIDSIRDFAESRGFDLCWYPGITPEETNRFTILDEPVYYNAAAAILGENRDGFFRAYLFNITPPTDDRPHFFQFFRWSTLRLLLREMGFSWIPFMEWGYIILVLTLAQGALASAVFILLPLLVLSRRGKARGVKKWVVFYFSCLGVGFMFLEIAFIQKLMLFLAYPVYAVAVVLAGFLVFSGLGSLAAHHFRGNRVTGVKIAVGGLCAVILLYIAVLPPLFRAGAGWNDPVRIAASLLILFPPAFFMGVPFPTGMQLVSSRHPEMVPWAWGINGFASVMGASLATFTAIHLGFRVLLLLALAVYLLCVPVIAGLNRTGKRQ